jgi:zinc protease
MRRLGLLLALVALACGGPPPASLPPPVEPLAATPDAPFRHRPPVVPLDAVRRPRLTPRRAVLPNGLALTSVDGTDPNVVLAFLTRGLHENLSVEDAGLSMITGEAALRSTVVAEGRVEPRLLERSGFRPIPIATPEGMGFALRVEPSRWRVALQALARAVRAPAFHPGAVDDLQAAMAQRLDRSLRSSTEASYFLARRRVFPEADRWAFRLLGRPQNVRRFTPDRMAMHWSRQVRPGNSALVAVGRIPAAGFEAAAAEALGGWSLPEPAAVADTPRAIPRGPVRGPPLSVVVAAIEEPLVLYYSRAPSRTDPHHPAFEVLTRILGGMFVSRLGLELRETEGYTYGVHAIYEAHRDHGVFKLQTTIRGERVAVALQAFVDEVARLRERGPEEEELAIARTLTVESAYALREGNVTIGLHLARAFAEGATQADLDAEPERLAAVDASAVQAAAQAWLRPSEAALVVAGQRREIVERLRSAGFRDFDLRRLE